jgi:hypothetical protein
MSEFDTAWGKMTEKSDFPYLPHLLMPKRYWTTDLLDFLVERANGWKSVIDDRRNYFAWQVDISPEGYEATRTMFFHALDIAESGVCILRDQTQEQKQFEAAWDQYFPDELYIDKVQIPQMYKELTIAPAGQITCYLQAVGRVASGGAEAMK